ncbi:MAG: FAD-dependent oxidoreductase [Planctomycetes bacterium]|nr:FAD-dependent oxidoreductase [Planctomycetota bacterium]
MHRGIVIIGGGFSGTMTAVHLARLGVRGITLLERREHPARGVAYGTEHACHLLNVPAAKMSALPDEPDHFLQWLTRHEPAHAQPSAFVPRPFYARYLQALLDECAGAVVTLRDEAIAISPDRGGLTVETRGGKALPATRVVLALGNFPPGNPPIATPGFYSSRRYVQWAWAPHTFEGMQDADAVLLVGSGLTTVDKALVLLQREHKGAIHVLSRRGLVPQRHEPADALPPVLDPAHAPRTTLGLLKAVRAATRSHKWRAVIDSLRPVTQELWQNLPVDEKRRFMRRLRHFWDVHRHRVAPQVAEQLQAAIDAGRIIVHVGKLHGFHEDDSGVDALIDTSQGRQKLHVQRVINCTGPESNYRNLHHPLVASLLEQGLARTDALAMGLDTDDRGALIGSDGKASQVLFTLGPALKGKLWETTAVPELRTQARDLALRLASN